MEDTKNSGDAFGVEEPRRFIIVREGEGWALCSYDSATHTGSVDGLWVEPPCRRRGIGSALLADAERELVQRGARLVQVIPDALDATDASPEYFRRLETWYFHRGYRRVGKRGDWVRLAKDLP
jgi:ribosomal protein S18 acetylase RimI-like enzyme